MNVKASATVAVALAVVAAPWVAAVDAGDAGVFSVEKIGDGSAAGFAADARRGRAGRVH